MLRVHNSIEFRFECSNKKIYSINKNETRLQEVNYMSGMTNSTLNVAFLSAELFDVSSFDYYG